MIHAITAIRAFDEARKREQLSRRCPKCGSGQIDENPRKVAASATTACVKCGAPISPMAAAAAGGENQSDQKDETK